MNAGGVDAHAWHLGQALGQQAGILVVLRQPVDHRLQGNDTGRGDHSHLAHAASQHLACLPGARDEVGGAADQRAHRRRQALREAEGDGVHRPCKLRRRHAQGHGGVEDTGAVQVDGRAIAAGQLAHLGGLLRRDDTAAATVVGVLQADQSRARKVDILTSNGRLYRFDVQQAAGVVGHRAELNSAQAGGAADLIVQDMRLAADDRLVPALAVRQQAGEVSHRTAGDEDGGLLTHQLRCHRFQAIHGGVFAEDVVAHHGLRHCLSHGGRGVGDRIATQVDNARFGHGGCCACRPAGGPPVALAF